MSAQGTPLPGQLAQQWKLHMMEQEAALKQIATSRLRRLLARNESFTCTDGKIGGAVLSDKAQSKEGAP